MLLIRSDKKARWLRRRLITCQRKANAHADICAGAGQLPLGACTDPDDLDANDPQAKRKEK
jgi:hypothetical protein